LKCWYDHTSNPAWTINPLKKELLSQSPQILQVYEVIGNKMISKLFNLANSLGIFGDALVVDGVTREARQTLARTSVGGILPDHTVQDFNRQLELLLGMNTTAPIAAEEVHIGQYCYGRHYAIHPDGLGVKKILI
jgi:hypothetical protein